MKLNKSIKNTQKYRNIFSLKHKKSTYKNKTQKIQKKECVYIFGYGSLIDDLSRFKTHKNTKKTYRAMLLPEFGYVRSWNTIIPNNQVVLGIEKNKKKDTPINGVLFKICKCCLHKFIERESHYNIRTVPKKYIQFTKNNQLDLKNNKVITFVTKPRFNTTKKLNKRTAKKYFIPKHYYSIIKKTYKKNKIRHNNKNINAINATSNPLNLRVK